MKLNVGVYLIKDGLITDGGQAIRMYPEGIEKRALLSVFSDPIPYPMEVCRSVSDRRNEMGEVYWTDHKQMYIHRQGGRYHATREVYSQSMASDVVEALTGDFTLPEGFILEVPHPLRITDTNIKAMVSTLVRRNISRRVYHSTERGDVKDGWVEVIKSLAPQGQSWLLGIDYIPLGDVLRDVPIVPMVDDLPKPLPVGKLD